MSLAFSAKCPSFRAFPARDVSGPKDFAYVGGVCVGGLGEGGPGSARGAVTGAAASGWGATDEMSLIAGGIQKLTFFAD